MKFSDTHEWVTINEGLAVVGISHYAQKELGDIVYVELPELNKKIEAGEECAVLESTKAAADVYSPISGIVIEINKSLKNDPSLVNSSPENEGWLFKLSYSDLDEMQTLIDEDDYRAKFPV